MPFALPLCLLSSHLFGALEAMSPDFGSLKFCKEQISSAKNLKLGRKKNVLRFEVILKAVISLGRVSVQVHG